MTDPSPEPEAPVQPAPPGARPGAPAPPAAGAAAPEEAERAGKDKEAEEAGRRRRPAQRKREERLVFWQKCWLVIALSAVSVAALLAGGWILREIERPRSQRVAVPWRAPDGVVLDSGGPLSFRHDRSRHLLIHRGPIDEETKARLIELFPDQAEPAEEAEPTGETEPTAGETEAPENLAEELEAARRSYREAIDQLAFDSTENLEAPLLWLLLLGAVGGLMGVQLRSASNFIGVVCIKNDFDLTRWWPWYVLRPVLGLFVGLLVVVLIKADLYTLETGSATTGNLWWLGLAVLAGFGAEDFVLRLRLISHTLFGVSELDKPKERKETEKPGKKDRGAGEAGGEQPAGDGEEEGGTTKPQREGRGEGDEGELTTPQKL